MLQVYFGQLKFVNGLTFETKTIDGVSFSTGYDYDGFGRLVSMTYPDGEVVSYKNYDPFTSKPREVSGEDVYYENAEYNALGLTLSWQSDNRGLELPLIDVELSYDSQFRVARYRLNPNGDPLRIDQTIHYDFNGNGQLKSISPSGIAQAVLEGGYTYEYDGLNRIDQVLDSSSDNPVLNYDYDAFGNLISRTVGGQNKRLDIAFDDPNFNNLVTEVSHVSWTAGDPDNTTIDLTATYEHDKSGNLITQTIGMTTTSYLYDAANRLVEVVVHVGDASTQTVYVYDPLSNLINTVVNTIADRYHVSEYAEIGGLRSTFNSPSGKVISSEFGTDVYNSCVDVYMNQPYFVWRTSQASSQGQIIYKTPSEPPQLVPVGTENPFSPDIAVTKNRTIHVVWGDGREILYAYKTIAGEWSAPQNLTEQKAGVHRYPRIDVNPVYPDQVSIFWRTRYNDMAYVSMQTFAGDQMQIDTVSQAYPGDWTIDHWRFDIAFDSQGHTHLVAGYMGGIEGALGANDSIYYSKYTGYEWVDSTTFGTNSGHPVMVIDDQDQIHVVWREYILQSPNSFAQIHYETKLDGGAWIAQEIISDELLSFPMKLMVGQDGDIHFMTDDAHFYHTGDKNWQTTNLVSPGLAEVHQCHVEYDGSMIIHTAKSVNITYNGTQSEREVVHYPIPIRETVKHYNVNGQNLATRIDGDLYYTSYDPSGTSVTITSIENESAVNMIAYDSYGAVQASVVPIDDEIYSLLNDSHSATGLIHRGNGQFYDPLLGRPLQPNLSGASPDTPQGMNRFSASIIGQPGVAAAEANRFWWQKWVRRGVGASYSLGTTYYGNIPIFTGDVSGSALISIRGKLNDIRTVPFNNVRESFLHNRLLKQGNATYEMRMILAFDDAAQLNRLNQFYTQVANSADLTVERNVIIARHHRQARKAVYGNYDVDIWLFRAGLDIAIGLTFQYMQDYNDPFLSSTQKGFRSLASSGGSAIAGNLGAHIGRKGVPFVASLLGLSAYCGPGAIVCAIGGSIIGVTTWNYFQPAVFELVGLAPRRNLYKFE